MKIGIVSFFSNGNNGSNLQALALQTLLRGAGHVPSHIRICKTKQQKIQQCFQEVWEAVKHPSYWHWIIAVLRRRMKKEYWQPKEQKYFGLSSVSINASELTSDKFDAFVVGSDQVWSPVRFPFEKSFFLPRVSREKKMAYAVSFGVDRMPPFNTRKIERYVQSYKYLSFRETTVIKSSDISVEEYVEVLDPTLLLAREEWDELVERYSSIEIEGQEYALIYFLDDPNEEQVKKMKYLCKCMNISKMLFIGKGIEKFEQCNIQKIVVDVENLDFIKVIRESNVVFTDSYHGSIFSVIYQKRLAIFKRNNDKVAKQFNRIQELAVKLSFEKLIVGDNINNSLEYILNFQFEETVERIAKLTKCSKDYLFTSLQDIERFNNGTIV